MTIYKWVRRGDQAAVRFARRRRHGSLDLRLIMHWRRRKLGSERSRGLSESAQENGVIWCCLRVEHERYPLDAGCDLFEHFQPIFRASGSRRCRPAHQAGNETLPSWIADDGKDDWNRPGRLFQGRKRGGGARDNDIRCRTDQFARVCLRLGEIGLGKPLFNSNVAVCPSESSEPFPSTVTRACASGSFSASACRNPTLRIRSGCCARAGQATVPPSPAIDSRRLIIRKSPPR
jgi:hypothetical protein